MSNLRLIFTQAEPVSMDLRIIGMQGPPGSGGGGGGGPVAWDEVNDKPATFPPEDHEHQITDVVGLPASLRDIDLKAQLVFLQANLTEPPVSPSIGDRYAIAVGATGEWAARDGDIAEWTTEGWVYLTPSLAWRAWNFSENQAYFYFGDGLWEQEPFSVPNGSVTNPMLDTVPGLSLKGRAEGTFGPVTDLNAAQVRTLLNVENGATANATNASLRDRTTHTGEQAIETVTGLGAALDGKQAVLGFTPEDSAQKGQPDGYAALDGTGKVPAAQLPAYVDDVIEVDNFAALPATGETGKIYVTLDDNKTWRWSGSAYVEISPSPGSTDSVTEGSVNLYHTPARVRATDLTGYAEAGSRTALVAGDTILGAFGKVGKWLADLGSAAFASATSAGLAMLTAASAAAQTALLDTFTSGAKGLAPASGGGTTNFLRADGSWAAPPGGGGSGDVVGPASSVDDLIAGFDGTTGKLIKQGTTTLTELADLLAEVIAARGDRASLDQRIGVISNFASPNVGGVLSTRYYDHSPHATGSTTIAGAANRCDLMPFYTSVPLAIDRIGVAVSTAAAGALGRIGIYGSGADGWPSDLLYEGPSDLDLSTTGYKFHGLTFQFDSGTQYWLAVRHSSTATLRAIPVAGCYNLGLTSDTANNYFTEIRRTITFADPLPSTWGFMASELNASIPPSVRFRAA